MMSLSQLHEKISALSTLNEDAVHEGIADIFYYLLYGDQQFYTVTASGLPIASATSSDTAHRYLRLFSHQELADRRAARSEGVSVQTVSALESVKLAKSGLMAGIYGYVLNEGDKWIAIPLAEYLSIFCARILKEPDMFCQECAELVLFIGELRNKEPTRFFAVCDDSGGWAVLDETCFILPNDCPVPDTLNNCELRPVTDSLLADISSNSVCIKIEKGDLVVSRELLSAARCYCRFGDEDSDSILSNWHSHSHDIESLSLVFSPELDEPTELPKAEEDTSDKDMESNAVLPLSWAHKIAAIASGFATKIRTKIKAACPAAKMLSSNSPALDSDVPVVQEEGSGEAVGEQSEDLCRHVRGSMKKKHVVLTSSVCCVLIFLLVAAIGIRRYQYQQRFDQFCTYVDDRDYGNAYSVYRDYSLGTDADDFLRRETDNLVMRYARNEISAEELAAALRALSNFSAIEQDLLTAQIVASKLEASKNAYVLGKESSDVYSKLSTWRQVINLDSVNYVAVQSDVSSNQEAYLVELDQAIEYYSTRARSFAVDRYEVLAYWFPDVEQTSHWAKEYDSSRTVPLSMYPISISSISIHQTVSGYWTMHIDWENTSIKEIKEVCFSVIALDSNGNPVTNRDAYGSWTIYDAKDIGSYLPGEGTPSDTYVWSHVFYGSMIAQVKLTAVNITFRDGSSSTFTEDVDLSGMYHQF